MFSSLGRATYEQDAWRIRPFMPHTGTGGAANTPEWVPVVYGWNETNGTQIPLTSTSLTTVEVLLPTDEVSFGLASFVTPKDYTGDITINSVVYMGASQTMVFRTGVVGRYHPSPAGSGVWNTSPYGGHQTEGTVTSDAYNGWYSVAAHPETVEQQTVFWVTCVRKGTATTDTSTQSARHHGWYIQYG